MTAAVGALYDRLRIFSPGDVMEAAEILDALEKAIVHEETDFDDAALLSRAFENFSLVVKDGVNADWAGFLATLPGVESLPAAAVPPVTVGVASAQPRDEETEVDVEVLFSFLTEAREHLETIEDRILSLEGNSDPKTVNEIFRSVHTIKGVAGFLNLFYIKKLSHELEFLLEELRSKTRSVDRSLVDVLLLGCDTLGELVQHVAKRAAMLRVEKGVARLSLDSPPIDEVLDAIARIRSPDHGGTPAPPPKTPAMKVTDVTRTAELIAKFILEAMETLEAVERCILTMEKTGTTADHLSEAFRSVHTLKGNAGFFGFEALETLCMETETLLDALRKGHRSIDTEAVETLLGFLDRLRGLVQAVQNPPASLAEPAVAAEASKTDTESLDKYTVKKKDIRVDTDKLDSLFDLIGELITAEAMVIDNPDLRGLELDNFTRASTYLSKITRELQAVTMSIRMIPLEGLFSKMHRLVRDLGRKFAKDIELEISGAETEMDRNIIEEISDPLVHIIRNAIDHGIENVETRRTKGKSGGGCIRLNARYEGNEIWITVGDDGAGLNRNRILEVARSRGLIGEEELPDADVWKLIFEPGFSTAHQVSEISGRGVGMDVVRKNIDKLRGQIDIRSVTDQGTDFVLKIPLTLAIIDGVTLRSGTTLYSIPIADVVEFQNYLPERVTKTDPDHSVLRLRDEVLPLLWLSEIFVSSGCDRSQGKKVSIIVKSQNRKVALVVDEIVGYKQIVLKALPESMSGLEGISGCTILGNGEVSLIIDVHALFSRTFA